MNWRLVLIVIVAVVAFFAARGAFKDDAGNVDDAKIALDDAKIALDDATWKPLKQIVRGYQAAPGDWHRSAHSPTRLAFSAPCELQHSTAREKGLEFPAYECDFGSLHYAVVIAPTDQALNPQWIQPFWIAHDDGMLARVRESDPAAKRMPLARIRYEGLEGREHRIDSDNGSFIVRLVATRRGAVTLLVVGPAADLPADAQRFFDSLELTAGIPALGKND